MGIHGLLPLLKSVMVPFHIKELEGCSVAVDTYSWLHKGALSCSTQLCKGIPTTRHIEYCMHRVNLLRHYGVKPILVFDGGLLPMKIEQENKRARSRKENLARAVEHESNGNSAAAYECYQKAVDISPSIAHDLIQILKKENVSFVVAPYEADAQMTFLAISKQVHAVITEDSDLIPFGCPRIIFKMDKYGQGVEFHYSRLQRNKELSFVGFSHKMLLEMCILSGCDYLQSLPGMGLKRAHALISKFKSYEKVIKHLRYSTVCVPPSYEESFHKALMTFQHQRVYDPITEALVYLSDLSDKDADDLDFLGPMMPQHLAKGIAEGNLDPFTCMPFKDGCANLVVVVNQTAELKNVKPEKGRKKLDLPVQKNILTKYFCFASLEAKRSFTAPRKSPILPVPVDESSPSAKELCTVKNMDSSSSPQFSPDNVKSTPPEDTVQSDSAAKILGISEASPPDIGNEKESSDHILPSKFGDSVHMPSEALLKECDNKNVSGLTENKKIITRSSYFKPKSVNNASLDNQQEKLSANNGVASDTNILRSSYKTIIENNKVVVRSSYFQSKSNKNYQNTLQEKHLPKADEAMDSDKNRDFITEVASRSNTNISLRRKAWLNDSIQENTKSKHKGSNDSVSENGCHALDRFVFGTKTEEKKIASHISYLGQYYEITDKSMDSDKNQDFITEGATRNKTGISLKRKASLNDSIQENMKLKHKRANESVSENDCHALDRFEYGTKTEEKKFGSNISHLGQYSDIADKSMERFVSVISSFRYSSTGSRAPLKDIRNTHPYRSNPDLDLSRFAYKPKNKKSSGV